MTLLKIAQLGHPVLLEEANSLKPSDIQDAQSLIDDMIETMEDARGVGLAAPQVYRSLRLFVAKRADLGDAMDDHPPFVIINPKLRPLDDACAVGLEGCLSIPGYRALVTRHCKIGYEGLDRHGAPLSGQAEGFFARIIQHEYDHLDGILYPARLENWSDMAADSEADHLMEILQPNDDEPLSQ